MNPVRKEQLAAEILVAQPNLLGSVIAQKPFIDGHREKPLLAFVTQQSVDWLARIEPEETDKYVMMAAANLVECIAYVELPAESTRFR